MEFRKNKWKMLVLIVLLICIYSVWNVHSEYRGAQLTNQDFIRFHVIANSNSDQDQELKLKVRDGLLEEINGELAVEAMSMAGGGDQREQLSLERSREYIEDHLNEIERTAEKILKAEGCDYSVKAELGARFVPEKTYGNVVFPAGTYEALNVTIGAGDGHNWWCVLFPPLCMIGAEAPEELQFDPLMAQMYLDPKYKELLNAAQGEKHTTLKLEFKTLNYMNRID